MSASMLALGVVVHLTDKFSGPLGEAIKRTESLSKTASKLIGIGVGMNAAALATSGFSQRMRGNLMGLADSIVPLESMPRWLQYLGNLAPCATTWTPCWGCS